MNAGAPSTHQSARKLFISHATADRELVEGFVRFLESAVGVPQQCIFCSSMPGSKIPGGANFRDAIVREASQSAYIVALITNAFIQSPFCWSELGAGWVLGDRLKPFVVAPLTYASVTKTVIGDLQCLTFDPSDLAQFRDELSELYPTQVPTARWEQERERFLKMLADMKAEAVILDPGVQMPAELQGEITLHGEKQAALGGRIWKKSVTWQQIFLTIASLIETRNELAMRHSFVASIFDGNGSGKINDPDWSEIVVTLNLSKLVVSKREKTIGGGFQTFWSLTPEGRNLATSLRQKKQ